MDRALKAPLSPNEEATLRRVSQGIAETGELRARDVERLVKLTLIEQQGLCLALTEAGQQRLASVNPVAKLATLFDSTVPKVS